MQKVPEKDNSKQFLAIVLIGIGLLWILKQTGIFYHFPFFHLDNVFSPIRHTFHGLGHIFVSWQMVLIIVGAILLAGKRSGGLVLIIIGTVFILPKLFFFSGITLALLLPVILIGVGVALVARLI
ncbi:MAG: hypothetical protein ABFS16_06820 [Bacteroidota bacterium]